MLKRMITRTSLPSDLIHSRFITIIGFILSVIVAAGVWYTTDLFLYKNAQDLFEHYVHDNSDAIDRRMHRYENALRSGVGFMQGSSYVSREEWRQFVQTLDPEKYYSGMQGIGFSMMLTPEQVGPIEEKMREEGYSSFLLRPEGKRDRYSAILYLEPLDKRNQAAIGYDMYSEPTRREAMQRAADTGSVAVSGKVKLVQEIDKKVQAGCLMYLPFYKTGEKIDTVEDRRRALIGFVYSPFRMNDLMEALGEHDESIQLEIYDGPRRSADHLLYRTKSIGYLSEHTAHKTINIGGRIWHLYYSSTRQFDRSMDTFYPIFAAMVGLGLYFILLYTIVELLRSRRMLQRNTVELELSRSWFQKMLESSVDGIHILDTDGNLIECSPSFLQMLGYDEHDVHGLSVYDWEAKLSHEEIRNALKAVSAIPMSFETEFRRKDGSLFDVEITARRIDADGVAYLYASSREITERKKIERALVSEKESAQNYLDIVDVMILVIDTDFTIKLINRRGCEILGYSASDVVGKNFVELFIPERIRRELFEVAAAVIDHDAYECYENPIVTKRGEERLIAWRNHALLDEFGTVIGILSSGEDITDSRKNQQLIRESEEFYRTLFASINEAVCILADDRIIDCNDEAVRLFEMTKQQLIGMNIFDTATHIECRENDFAFYLDAAYHGNATTMECALTLSNHNNENKIIEFTLSGFGRNNSNKLVLIARDITDQIEQEKLFKMQTRQAQMGEMISMIAHQWRQPLAIINAITSQMRLQELMKEENDPLLIENLIKIEEQSVHLSRTITDYRDFFRPDKPKELFYISALIDHALSLIDHTLKNYGITIKKVSLKDPKLISYRNEVLQVFIALLKNALDAFQENDVLRGSITIVIDQDEHFVIVSIHDNAGGIAPDVMNKLFIPYFTTKHKSGTGLGLYMSKVIIEDHCAGILEVMSEHNETTFTIKLPYENPTNQDRKNV